jgi:outer membrane protein assembly factor BamA
MARLRFLACAAAMLAVFLTQPATARAQDQAVLSRVLGKVVTSVTFDIEGTPAANPALTALVDVKVGQPLTLAGLRSSEERLTTVGQFEEVAVDARESAQGVDLTFSLSPRHPIDRVEIAGDDLGLERAALDKTVHARFSTFASVSPASVAGFLQQALIDEGYLSADVTPTTVKTHNPDRATLVLTVAAGPRAVVTHSEVRPVRNLPITADEILTRTGARAGAPYRRRAIEAALASIRSDLQGRGYYAAVATVDRPVVSADRQGVQLTFIVDSGPRVDVRYEGDAPPSGDIENYVPIRREGAADDDLLEDSRGRLENGLKNEGFVNARVSVAKDTSSADVLVVTFHISRGPRFRVARIDVPSNLHLAREILLADLGIVPGDAYNESRVLVGLNKVLREYQALGYYTVKAEPAYKPLATPSKNGETAIALEPTITEGPRGTIAAILFNRATMQIAEAKLISTMQTVRDGPYVLDTVASDRDRLEALYLNNGFRNANVDITPEQSVDGTRVTLTIAIDEGPQIIVGSIDVVGQTKASPESIKEDMTLQVGQPFSEEKRLESQSRLAQRGVFRSVSIQEEPRLPGETKARVIVSVVESPATVLGYGGGLEADRRTRRDAETGVVTDFLQLAPRAFFQVDRKNLFGRDRTLSFFTRFSFKAKPQNQDADPTVTNPSGYGFSEYRVSGTYRQRNVAANRTILFGVTSEQEVQTGYNFVHQLANAEVQKTITTQLNVSARYALDLTKLFDVQIPPDQRLEIDRLFPQVRLSLFSGSVLWDRRNDPIVTQLGVTASADVEVAVRALGSEVGYDKAFVQASAFRPLVPSRRFVLAGRAELGLAHGFPREGLSGDQQDELPASQRFFAGGGTTVRGFQQDRLGYPNPKFDDPPGPSNGGVLTPDGLSNGGNGLVVLNLELRTVVRKIKGHDFGVVVFTDAGNVFEKASDVDMTNLRASAGFGFRYDSSLGPFRLDFGYKLHPDVVGGVRERGWEYHLSLGEAF